MKTMCDKTMMNTQMILPIPELEEILSKQEHMIGSLKCVLNMAREHCAQQYPINIPYITADGIIARDSIEQVQTIIDLYTRSIGCQGV